MRIYWNDWGVWEPRKTRQQVKAEMEYQMRNWYYYTWLCGDHIVEQHIHNLDVANWIKGDHPVKCWGMGGRQVLTDKRYGEIFDHHCVEYEYADGSRVLQPVPAPAEHLAERHRARHRHQGDVANVDAATRSSRARDEWKYRGHQLNPYQIEHADLFAADPRQPLVQRSGKRSAQHADGHHGPHGDLLRQAGRLGRGPQLGNRPRCRNASPGTPNPRDVPLPDGSYPVAIPGVTKAV